MKRTVLVSTALGLALFAAGCAKKEVKNPIVTARHENYEQVKQAFRAIGDELKKESPSFEVIDTNAEKLDALAKDLPSWFPEGSGPETGAKTEALPVIWEKWPDFEEAAGKLQTAVGGLVAASSAEDLGLTGEAAKNVGGACKSCHDTFRKEDD